MSRNDGQPATGATPGGPSSPASAPAPNDEPTTGSGAGAEGHHARDDDWWDDDDDWDNTCTFCRGDGYDECYDPEQCTTPGCDGEFCMCRACDGRGYDQTVW